jgi:hypothetical protein
MCFISVAKILTELYQFKVLAVVNLVNLADLAKHDLKQGDNSYV